MGFERGSTRERCLVTVPDDARSPQAHRLSHGHPYALRHDSSGSPYRPCAEHRPSLSLGCGSGSEMTLASALRPVLVLLARGRDKRLKRKQVLKLLSQVDRQRDYPGSRRRRLTP